MIAAADAVDVQAQSDTLTIAAKEQVDIMSAHAHIDWAAAKSISLSTAGGANITIAGGNITVQCPGKIMVQAGKKSFVGSDKLQYVMPVLPKVENSWVEVQSHYDDAWNTPWPLHNLKFNVDGTTTHKSVPVNPLKGKK